MFLRNTTPDGTFTLTIRCERAYEEEDEISDASLLQFLERTAQTLRLAVDPDLQHRCLSGDPVW